MTRKFRSTGTITLSLSGANTVISAPTGADANETEFFLRRLVAERTDTAIDVTLLFLNNESPTPRAILPSITLNSDKGTIWLEFNDDSEVGVGGGKAFVIDASVANKVKVWVEYRTGTVLV